MEESLSPEERERLRKEAQTILTGFDELRIHLVEIHAAIHKEVLDRLASRLGSKPADLPKLKFMHAVRMAYAGEEVHQDLVGVLRALDAARNSMVHGDSVTQFVLKHHQFLRQALAGAYQESPSSVEDAVRQDREGINFVYSWVRHS